MICLFQFFCMNLKKSFLITIALYGTLSADAQYRKYTMAEAVNGLSTTLALKSIKQPSWQPGTHNFYQVIKEGTNEFLIKTHFPLGIVDTMESLSKLNKSLGRDSMKSLPVINWLGRDYAYYNKDNKLRKGTLTSTGFIWSDWINLPKDAENVTVDRSVQLAYTTKNNLWMADKYGKIIQVTNESNENIISGQAVHRNEFGIEGGIFFSPQGNYLAYYRMDQTMINDYPIVRWGSIPATVDLVKYPMAGGISHQVTLCVYNPKTGKTISLKTGMPKDQYLTSVTWSPDEKYIYIALLNREQNHLQLNQYSAETGDKIKTLFEESSNTYVEPLHPLTFLPNSSNKFIWWSEADGYSHLYVYNTNGTFLKQLTKGDYDVNELIGFNEETNEAILTSAKQSPLEKNVYAVNYVTGAMRRVDKEAGIHTVSLSEDGQYIYDSYTSANVPKVGMIRTTDGSFAKEILNADNTLKDFERPQMQSVMLKADDGTPLYSKLILPTHFNPAKKYPVIVYLYNGPHVQLVRNTFPESGNLWYEYLAQHGYVVFTMDGRGSDNRGRKFEQATFRKLGTVEMNDQLKGVDYLKSLAYVDAGRMGVHGWSFGGFMTTSLMLRHPGVFKVGVAGGPVMDWSMYEIMYTERYMDTPQENPKGYEDANLLTKTKNLRGKLMLIHGTDDNVVVWQHSINFLKKAVDENVQVDYFVYPGYEHNVRGKDRVHLMQKITDYFDLYLKP